MAKTSISSSHLEKLRQQLHDSLFLDFDEYGLQEQSTGEFNSTYLGVQLNSAFQPIYDSAAGELHGHEAFLRPSLGGELPSSPEFAFSYAEQSGKLVQFDRVSRTLHVLNFRQIYDENGLLFLNVHPKLLISVSAHGKVFERILHSNSVATERIVIEIKEALVEQDKQLLEAIDNYRDRGYKIALDNFGSDRSNIDRLWKFSPEYVKFDLSVIQAAQKNSRVHQILPALVRLVKDSGAKPVFTGIETQLQLDIAFASGGELIQGNFLGKPATADALQEKRFFPSAANRN